MRLLRVLQQMIKFRTNDLRDYINEASDALRNKQSKLESEIDAKLDEIADEDEKRNVIDWYLDDNLKYFDDFPEIQNNAHFLILYSFFETNLSRICGMIVRDVAVEAINLKPAKGSYVNNSKDFLSSVPNVNLTSHENVWRKLEKLRQYRNFITHDGANLKRQKNKEAEKKKRDLIAYINRHVSNSIKINQHGECTIESHQLSLVFLELIKSYLNFIIDHYLSKHPRK